MKRGWQRLLGVALLMSGVACGNEGSRITGPSASAPSGSFTLSGTVVEDSDRGGRPSYGAKVLAAFGQGERAVNTGLDGSFTITDLPAGAVQVIVTKARYDEVSQQVEMNGNVELHFRLWRSKWPPEY